MIPVRIRWLGAVLTAMFAVALPARGADDAAVRAKAATCAACHGDSRHTVDLGHAGVVHHWQLLMYRDGRRKDPQMSPLVATMTDADMGALSAFYAAQKATARPATLIVVSGVLSALFVNDVVCLVLAPLVVDLTRRLALPPLPYLVALATASNVGSVATLTGNPQNMLVGSFSGIPYRTFLAREAPVAVVGLVFLVVCSCTTAAGRASVPRRRADRARGHRGRGLDAPHPPREAGEGLPGDQLAGLTGRLFA